MVLAFCGGAFLGTVKTHIMSACFCRSIAFPLRSFRCGCMTLRANEDNVWKQLSTTEGFLKRCAGHYEKNLPKIIRTYDQNGPEILPKGVCGGHPSLSGPTSDTGCISRPSREPCFAVSASLGNPLGTPRGPFGATFSRPFSFREGPEPENGRFLGCSVFGCFFYTSFYGFRGVPDAKTMDSVWER